MKSIILLFSMVILCVLPVCAQDMQYVASKSGDTLVVKSDADFGSTNTLYLLMASDSTAPATRVYVLENGQIYSLANNPVTSSNYRTIIMGQTQTSLKLSQGAEPPIITGDYETNVNTDGGMTINKDLLIKNVDLEIGNTAGNGGGWAWFGFGGAGMRLQVDNCIMEHTWWTWVGGPPANTSVFLTNDYFVNLDGHTCRRNGGVTDFNANGITHQDTLFVENCTHVNTQGTLYKFRYGVSVDKVLFNHNTFVDNSGYVFMNNGDQANMSVTNNIFVNVQLQGYSNTLQAADPGEVDMDSLAMGIINVRSDSTFQANGASFYADKNVTYWDPRLSNIASTLNADTVNSAKDWVSQMIIMNSRTTNLFADKTHYPKLNNGTWISQEPTFTKTDVLLTSRLDTLKSYSLACVSTRYGSPLSSWRQAGNAEAANFIYADWPIPINLSYTDANLLSAGFGHFPVGDLDWFPTQYATWKAQESAELTYIQTALSTGVTSVRTEPIPQSFQLKQNYPNPFNPSTNISYTITKAGNVTLKVYNVLGQEVATLVNGYQNASTYNVNFDASNLASGVYIYKLSSGSYAVAKKMVLMK